MSQQTVKTTCPYCGVGCGVLAMPKPDGSVQIKGDKDHPANFGRLCSKGSALGDTVGLDHRLLHPYIGDQQVDWDTALNTVSDKLRHIINTYGPDSVAFYVSGQLLTEDYYVANKLMKGFIGSANIDTNSRLCMSSAVAGYKRAFGSDSVPCSYEDLEQADLIVIEGSNAAWCHPVTYQRIAKAKQDRPKMKIIVIDPRQTATCDIADLHLPIKPGEDAILFNGLLAYLNKQDALDTDFIDQHTNGFDDALSAAKSSAGEIEQVATDCELSLEDVRQFFNAFTQTERVITFYSQGVNQSSSGTDKSNSIINCHLATGRIGRVGMGPFSITGQPNAMGGREVGGLSNQLAAHMEIENPAHHDRVSRFWQTDNLATKPGLTAVKLFQDAAAGKVKAIWVMATNPAVSLPDGHQVKQALEQCELVIVSDCEAQTDTSIHADIRLPALAWGEKEGSVTNSERRISLQRSFLPPPQDAKADWWIICEVAKRMGYATHFDYPDVNAIFQEHAQLSGFENNGSRDFDISAYANINKADYARLTPTQWPVTKSQPEGTVRLFENKSFFTPDKKARFIAITPRPPIQAASTDYPLILNTGRVRDQWHTMTRTARASRLNSHIPEPIVQIHPDDATQYQLEAGALARVSSDLGAILARVAITDSQRQGSIFVPIHWNQQVASSASVGQLIAPEVDPVSGQPEFKHAPVAIAPYQAAWHGFMITHVEISPDSAYWVKIRGNDCWRYELADAAPLDDATDWAKQQLLGIAGDWLYFHDTTTQRHRFALIENDVIQAVLFIGATPDLPTRDWLSQLFQQDSLTDNDRRNLLAGSLGQDQPDTGPIICACFGVGEYTIQDAISCGDAKTVSDLGQQLKAGTNCGSCIPELQKLLG